MSGPVSFVTTADGVRIAFAEHGDGPPIVFVRGWVTHLELMWDEPEFRAFFEAIGRRHRVVRFDARGNGLSDRVVDRLDLDGLTMDLEAVMDGLSLEDVTLWGSSFGGPIAATYAARHGDRVNRLVLEGTFARGHDIGDREQRLTNAAMISALRADPGPALAALSYITDPQPTTSHDRRVARMRRSIEPQTATVLYGGVARLDVSDVLRSIRVPTLVMHRQQSRTFAFEAGRAVAKLVPGARFVSLIGASHNPWEEHPEEVLLALGSFLEDGDSLVGALGNGTSPRAPMSPGPELVAILFTDLVESTAITRELGDADAQALLREHNEIVRDALGANRGTEIKHTGDGIMARFATASRAIACAVDIQDRFRQRDDSEPHTSIAVRIGINTGEPIQEEDDVFGTAVQMAARLCAHAEPGQIVVSNVVRELTAGKGLAFKRLPDATFKGFVDPVPVYLVEP
jgi:pimeloyl-ACP methyl ester carboxylesterase/class 3 adenylate cyclase